MLPSSTCTALRWRALQPLKRAVSYVRCASTASKQQQQLLPYHVSSSSSPTFKRLLALSKQSRDCSPPASLLVEGRTLIQHVASSPWQLARLILTERTLNKELERHSSGDANLLQLLSHSTDLTASQPLQLTATLARRLSHATTPSEYVAEFNLPAAAVVQSPLSADMLVVDGVSDPTNLASLVRSAHAFGFRQLALRQNSCSPYSHKVVAGSAGSIAYVGVHKWDEALERELESGRAHGRVCVIGLVASAGKPLRVVAERVRRRREVGAAVWLVVGNESRGMSEDMLEQCDELCTIPMTQEVESLNAAAAASIACYELGSGASAESQDRASKR